MPQLDVEWTESFEGTQFRYRGTLFSEDKSWGVADRKIVRKRSHSVESYDTVESSEASDGSLLSEEEALEEAGRPNCGQVIVGSWHIANEEHRCSQTEVLGFHRTRAVAHWPTLPRAPSCFPWQDWRVLRTGTPRSQQCSRADAVRTSLSKLLTSTNTTLAAA